jgi:PAS domain S-box-containing protein
MFKLIVLFIIILSTKIFASDEIRFGVFSYLGQEATKQRYEPLVKYLNKTLNKKVTLEVLTQEEINQKIAKQELDIVTTNPTHFLVIRQQYKLSGAIATLVGLNEDIPTSKLGGVIIVRDDSPIKTLKDIKNKTIATPSTKHMGGFRAQVYELYQAGVNLLDNPQKILELKTTHQDVVYSILERKADVGFIRDGILERMINNNQISEKDIRIINEQINYHPYKVSTRLYPEWPVFALPHTNENDVKQFVAALFSLEPTIECATQASIYGYTMPADYLEVEELARTLRLPPFDKILDITYQDIWNQYKVDIIIALIALIIVIIYYTKEQRRKKFVESLLANMGEGVYGVDKKGLCIWINQKALDMLQFKEYEVLYKNQHELFHHHKLSNDVYDVCECPIHLTLKDRKTRDSEEYFIKKNGAFLSVHITVAPIDYKNGAIVIFRDITKIKEYEKSLELEVNKKTKELNELNKNLQLKVEEALAKNKQKDILLQQQSRNIAIGEMMSNIAHQWRQPLSAITSSVSGLKLKEEFGILEESDIDNANECVMKNAEFLSTTIDNFRKFFKKDSSKKIFIISNSIKSALNIIQSTYDNFLIQVNLDLDESIDYYGDETLLSQAILNILSNSKDAFVKNNITDKRVTIELKKEDKQIIIKLKDNAGGIDDIIKDKIFDPYFTTKHQSQGTGLGLYMSSQIIQNDFNGFINMYNKEDKDGYGACFVIKFPQYLSNEDILTQPERS